MRSERGEVIIASGLASFSIVFGWNCSRTYISQHQSSGQESEKSGRRNGFLCELVSIKSVMCK